jgi:hypothetical protein
MRSLRVFNNEKGFVKLVFITAVLAFLIYAGIQFGMPYYRYEAFKSDVTEMARISLGNINKTRTDVLERARELNVPLDEDALVVTKTKNTVQVRASWSETVDIFGVYQKQLDFTVDIEE